MTYNVLNNSFQMPGIDHDEPNHIAGELPSKAGLSHSVEGLSRISNFVKSGVDTFSLLLLVFSSENVVLFPRCQSSWPCGLGVLR